MSNANMGPAGVRALTAHLHDADPSMRCAAIVALGKLGADADGALPDLIALMGDSTSAVDPYAGGIARNVGDLARLVIAEIGDEIRSVRHAAA